MDIIDDLPHHYQRHDPLWIPMRDGTCLAARAWLPEGAEQTPVPAILEYIPYRRRDGTVRRDTTMHPYFAGHGYAAVRVDLRGSGDSEGVLRDEYLEQELTDGEDVLKWLASQRWCNGSVGVIGISWGGFNGLQLAARQPPELKAIVTVCSTDDRYADDVHYMGGCVLGDNLSWASTMFALNSLPPDPDVVGERWREMWHERLQGSGFWLAEWMRHQHRDDYWKHGSVCEDFSRIRVPVMAASGWADGYSNAVFRLLARLEVPRRGLVGPWSHKYPHLGEPGPAMDFLHECVRWWDQWLKARDTGVTREPMLNAWMQDSIPPTTQYQHRPGRWVGEPSWPSLTIQTRRFQFSQGELVDNGSPPGVETARSVQSPLTCGLFAGKWCSYAKGPDLAHDQREDDGGALTLDSDPLGEPLEILGNPEVELELAADKPVAMVVARLSDVAPDDKATRVTYGLLNLTHRDSDEYPSPLEPGRRYKVTLKLNDIGHVFPVGHRLRLSLSTSYWPLAWPPPEPTRLSFYDRGSCLRLPERQAESRISNHPLDRPGTGTAPEPITMVEPIHNNWYVHRDLAADRSTLEVINDDGTFRVDDINLEVTRRAVERYSSVADAFDSIRGETEWTLGLRRGEWAVETYTRTIMTSDQTHFFLHGYLDAYEGERRVFSDSWDFKIPRNLV